VFVVDNPDRMWESNSRNHECVERKNVVTDDDIRRKLLQCFFESAQDDLGKDLDPDGQSAHLQALLDELPDSYDSLTEDWAVDVFVVGQLVIAIAGKYLYDVPEVRLPLRQKVVLVPKLGL